MTDIAHLYLSTVNHHKLSAQCQTSSDHHKNTVSPNTGCFFVVVVVVVSWTISLLEVESEGALCTIPPTPIPLFHIQTLGAKQFDTGFCNKPGQAGFLTHPAQKANLSQSTYLRFTSRLSELQPGNRAQNTEWKAPVLIAKPGGWLERNQGGNNRQILNTLCSASLPISNNTTTREKKDNHL